MVYAATFFDYKSLGKCNVSFNLGRAINAVFFFLAKKTLDNLAKISDTYFSSTRQTL